MICLERTPEHVLECLWGAEGETLSSQGMNWPAGEIHLFGMFHVAEVKTFELIRYICRYQ